MGPDVWRHVHAVSIVDSHGLFRSTTLHNLIGVVFIDRTELTTTCATAEALLHEGLHAKFDAIHRANPLTAALSSSSQSRVLAVWHSTNGDREWSVMRALAAFHVYAHLVFLADALINLGDTRDYGSRLYTRSLFRAHYLGNEILRTDADLTETGHDFIRWLLDLLPDSDGLSPNQRHLIRQGIPRLRS